MAKWFWMENGRRQGPVNSQELKAMAAAGRICRDTLVSKEGSNGWVPAARVNGLFEGERPTKESDGAAAETVSFAPDAALRDARQRAAAALADLRSLNWREELVPADESGLRMILRDYVFWCVVLLGVVPSLIGTIQSATFQLNAYLFFFAAMWGVVFRDFIVRAPVTWKWLLASATFTALIGAPVLLLIHSLLPNLFMNLRESQNVLVKLLGSVLVTGVTEELCKAIPVLAYLLWKRQKAQPLTAILLGVFSGLGFATVENIDYANLSMLRPLVGWYQQGAEGYVAGVQSAISNALLRSLSLVFFHAVLTGIVAYFLVISFLSKRRAPVLAVAGFALSALLHGCYNWLAPLQRTFATFIGAGAFLLFYGYVTKLRTLFGGQSQAEATQEPSGSNVDAGIAPIVAPS